MLRVVDNGLWAEVDSPEEAFEELPSGTRFWHKDYGQCIAADLEEQRSGSRRFWYFSLASRLPKVYGGSEEPFKFKIAAKHADDHWPNPEAVDWKGNLL